MSSPPFPEDLAETVRATGVIAVLIIDDVEAAVPLASALLEGGVNAMELTLRTDAALGALERIRQDVPDMLAGIGTVLTTEQLAASAAAGAAFAVAPGLNPKVVEAAKAAGLPFAPGVCTPSDVEAAIELGCRTLKFFPAGPLGGLSYLKSMAAPFLHLGVRFVPLGGVNIENMTSYLADDSILAVGGSWLAPRDLIAAGDWDSIRERAVAARRAVDELRVHGGQKS